jgi:hypothetical protein
MEKQAIFVDFMYAVAVGATLPRVDEKVLQMRNPLLWGVFFLIGVFLEDFYLYHVKVAPLLEGFPRWRGFVLAMLIIGTWYLSQAAFPTNPTLFLVSFAIFFLLKLLGGLLMQPTHYPSRQDAIFLLPAVTAFVLAFLSSHVLFSSHPGRILMVLAPVWFLTVVVWWSMDSAGGAAAAVK